MTEMEQRLVGGAVSGPVRVGDTVLKHLGRVPFDGAPRLPDSDDQGRDILSLVPGTVLLGPSLDEPALESAARLIRRAVALVDRDFAGMGPPLWDVAHSVWQIVLRLAGLGAPRSMRVNAQWVAQWSP